MLEEKNNNYDYMDERLPDDGGRSLEDIISAVGEQDLAEIPHVPMTPERLAALAAARDAEENLAASEAKHDAAENLAAPEPNRGAADENLATPTVPVETAKTRKKKRLYKLVGGIAAVFVLILIGAVVAFNALSVDVGADKNQKEEIVTEDGVVIEVAGDGTEHYSGEVWSTEDWSEVAMVKVLYPQLLIPEYIPNEYQFQSLYVEQLETGDITGQYLFLTEVEDMLEIEVFVTDIMLLSSNIENVEKTIKSTKGTIYIQEDEKKTATIQIDDGIIIKIWGKISDEEIVKIIDNLCI